MCDPRHNTTLRDRSCGQRPDIAAERNSKTGCGSDKATADRTRAGGSPITEDVHTMTFQRLRDASSPVWVRRCLCSSSERVNRLPQNSQLHTKGRSPVCQLQRNERKTVHSEVCIISHCYSHRGNLRTLMLSTSKKHPSVDSKIVTGRAQALPARAYPKNGDGRSDRIASVAPTRQRDKSTSSTCDDRGRLRRPQKIAPACDGSGNRARPATAAEDRARPPCSYRR